MTCTTERYFSTPGNAPEYRSENGTDNFLRKTRIEKTYPNTAVLKCGTRSEE